MHFLLWTKGSHENTNLAFSSVLMPICQILNVIFQTTSQFFFNFGMTLHCHEIQSSALFQVRRCILCTKGTNQGAKFFDFLVLRSKFIKFLSFLKQKISFSSNFGPLFGIMRHNSSKFFLTETLYTFSKSSLSKYKFGEISPEQLKV